MQTRKFEAEINAPKEIVWKVLWDDATYREWTKVFSEGSHAKSDWQEGSKIEFLNAKGDGMHSTIVKLDPNRFMSFRHDREIKNGVEQPLDDESRKWSGTVENYTLSEHASGTNLAVELGVTEAMEPYIESHFPKALANIKEIAEGMVQKA